MKPLVSGLVATAVCASSFGGSPVVAEAPDTPVALSADADIAAPTTDGLPGDLLAANGLTPTRTAATQLQGGLSASAWQSQGPALAPTVHDVLPGRAGGVAVMHISVPRRSQPGVGVKDLRVRVVRPKGVSKLTLTGKGWNCVSRVKTSTCRNQHRFGGRDVASHIKAVLSIRPTFSGSKRRIVAQVSWDEQKIVIGTGGNSGPIGSVHVVGWKRQALHETGIATIDPPLKVTLKASALKSRMRATSIPVVTGAGKRAREFLLTASVRNTLGRPTAVRWSQVSGPKVRFTGPMFQKGVEKAASQVVTVPNRLRKPATYTFAIRATSEGALTRRTVRVRVVPQRLGTFVSDPDDLNRLAAQQTRTPRKGQMGLDVPLSDVHSADISEKGPRWVSPGERTTLEFRSAEDIRTIAWTVADGTIDPATFEATGRTLTFTAPHKRGATALIQAVATMRDGDLIQRTKLIAVSTTQDSPLVGEGAPDANTTAFCALVAEASDGPATVTFLDGATLTMPQTVLPDGVTCDQADASLTLQKAVLAYAGATFNDVSGTITTGGVSIQTATYQLPASLQKWAQLVYDRGPVSPSGRPDRRDGRSDAARWRLAAGHRPGGGPAVRDQRRREQRL